MQESCSVQNSMNTIWPFQQHITNLHAYQPAMTKYHKNMMMPIEHVHNVITVENK